MTIEYEVLELFKPFLLGYCNCGCGKEIVPWNDTRSRRYFITGHHNKGERHTRWKGGRIKDHDYWYLYMPGYLKRSKNKYVLEHVYMFQEFHQCCMLEWGHVHHIVPIKKGGSNMPWNLQGMTRKQHGRLHNLKRNKNS